MTGDWRKYADTIVGGKPFKRAVVRLRSEGIEPLILKGGQAVPYVEEP